ncbi:uncharacterized protein VP01_590g7 [Puccinia sorghi]|uniref:YDG domain-containing protein n=1 Tax=Puccinia sorghi TaxID=27349 RepID=A0A0L6UHS7_9BASI|nr:uncharacterized protein VP01_590g7 [Puccinia sorghi]
MAPKATQTTESYEEIRQRNIAANRSLLLSLQLAGPGFGPQLIPKAHLKSGAGSGSAQEGQNTKKETKLTRRKSVVEPKEKQEVGEVGVDGRRRSGRILKQQQKTNEKQGQKSDGSSEDDEDDEYEDRDSEDSDDSEGKEDLASGHKRKSTWRPPSAPKRPRGSAPPQRMVKSLKGNRPNPKVFGQQIGTEVGDWWLSRGMCSQAGVHAPFVCGIAGSEGVGCYSVALSGGYEDDVDLGYAFTFSGSGGRALKGTPGKPKNLRTAPQSSDQEFTAMNASLRLSCDLKNPIRVIRGFKNSSPFAPENGYRYDGLYRVEKCWREAGQSGFQVCKFAFVRLPNQPNIPVKQGREAEAEQILRDMGIQTEVMAGVPGKCQPWTAALAKQRIQKQREAPAEPSSPKETSDLKPSSSSPENTNESSNVEPQPSLPKEIDVSGSQEQPHSTDAPIAPTLPAPEPINDVLTNVNGSEPSINDVLTNVNGSEPPINDVLTNVNGSEPAGMSDQLREAQADAPSSPKETSTLKASSPSPQNTNETSSAELDSSLVKEAKPSCPQEQSQSTDAPIVPDLPSPKGVDDVLMTVDGPEPAGMSDELCEAQEDNSAQPSPSNEILKASSPLPHHTNESSGVEREPSLTKQRMVLEKLSNQTLRENKTKTWRQEPGRDLRRATCPALMLSCVSGFLASGAGA